MSPLLPRVARFVRRHPLLRDALLWSLPALGLGLALRLMFLSYSPYAFWGADSESYYAFAHKLLVEGEWDLEIKRRFLYPLLMVPLTLLPGAPLRSVALWQHAVGWLTLLPLAYIVRKTLLWWRWWIIPVTLLYTGLPILLWYEHELLGDTLFYNLTLWTFAGWVAWLGEERAPRLRRLFWCFFVPLALLILTKPSARFYWPGLVLAWLLVQGWRRLSRPQMGALVALMVVTLFVGSKKQGAWLFYVATFPLTQTETPLHAGYKATIADLVHKHRDRLDYYYREDREPFRFLAKPDRAPWDALLKNDALRTKVYMDLATEAALARPLALAGLSLQRIVASSNLSSFREERFQSEYLADRLVPDYAEATAELAQGGDDPLPLALGLPARGPLPPYAQIRQRLKPHESGWAEKSFIQWIMAYERASDLVHLPQRGDARGRSMHLARPTWLGCGILLGGVLTLLPVYRRLLGTCTLIVATFLFTFFLISQVNPRYFGSVWPILLVLLAVPADALLLGISWLARRSARRASG